MNSMGAKMLPRPLLAPAPQHAPDALRRSLLLLALAAPWAAQARTAPPAEVEASMPGARLQGSGRLSFLGLHVYDARLWVPEGFQPADYASTPLALELIYARTLYGRLIAERTIAEMRKVGQLSEAQAQAWQAEMTKIFPDVGKGDRITGVQRPGEAARFYVNAQQRGELRDAAFVPLFFGIWLSPRTSEPKLRQALLGGTSAGG